MRRVLRAIAALLAVALGLEVGTRADEMVRLGTPFVSNASSIADIITIDSLGAHGNAGAQYRQFRFNSLGLRGPEPDPTLQKILVLGASETFGLYEPSGKEYPRQLQDSLEAAGCRVQVLNAALPGFSLPTLSVSFRSRMRNLGASVVVLYPTPVQYLEAERPVFRPHTAPPPDAPLTASLRAIVRLRDHVKAILPERVKTYLRSREIVAQRTQLGVAQWTSIPDDRVLAFHDDLAAFIDTLKASGLQPLVATHANAFLPDAPLDTARLVAWAKFYPHASMELLPQFEKVANTVIEQVAAEHGVPVSDVAAAMHAYDPDSVFADFSHFTSVGSARVAGVLSHDILASRGCPTRAAAAATR